MPQVIAVMLAGAGLYAGMKWLSRTFSEAQRRAEAEARRQEAVARGAQAAKDLGTLELDPQSGVYRPRTK
jgi:hypothetical protein